MAFGSASYLRHPERKRRVSARYLLRPAEDGIWTHVPPSYRMENLSGGDDDETRMDARGGGAPAGGLDDGAGAGALPRAGRGYGAKGQPCPYGYTQPNPNAGGW